MLKREIERFGGTVEKFIGDAVMAVFGAPVAHEDHAERAVRAALRIVEAIPELNEDHPGLELALRAAVNTGEAVVTLDARPERGEGFVAGALPYGDGITFWALGEVVKAHAGILESDGPEQAARKLVEVVDAVADEPDREWTRTRLGPPGRARGEGHAGHRPAGVLHGLADVP